MHYCYMLRSVKSGMFHIDTTNDIERGVSMHNGARFASTKPFAPWELVWQEECETEKEARDLAKYLKSSNGREYAYKRLIPLIYNNNYYYDNRGRIYEA